jgi:hypothetical protein
LNGVFEHRMYHNELKSNCVNQLVALGNALSAA